MNTASIQPIQKRAISDEIVDQLVDLIRREEIRPGERLPAERDLCRQFGVGRTTLREALRSLSTLGIIEGRVGEGTFVANDSSLHLEKSLQWGLLLDQKGVDDLIETRMMLECQTASSAATRSTAEDLDTIRSTVVSLEHALADQQRFLEADLEFHLAIAKTSQNAILANLLNLTRNYLQQWIVQSLDDPTHPDGERRARLSLDEHRAILAAIESGDAAEAEDHMQRHIESSSRDLIRRTQST